MSFHFSLLSLIARHITIVTPESTIQSYQYITTVMLFTRTQSSTLGPRCVISCSDLFTYLPSLRHSVLGDLSIIINLKLGLSLRVFHKYPEKILLKPSHQLPSSLLSVSSWPFLPTSTLKSIKLTLLLLTYRETWTKKFIWKYLKVLNI